ncbi:ABC transporter permease [Dactylosporangium sp. NPDC051484]|uniref:ABC transporter permease n=1 Tax=Dactylosporangium sp. NPDC051484 TaxID=3154942 RepID=UPI00344B7134
MLTVRRLAGAFVAVAIGVTIVALSTLLLASGRPHVPDRLAAAAVVVQSPIARTPADPFPPTRPWSSQTADELVRRLAAVPGVASAVADRSFYAQVLVGGRPDHRTRQGHGWSSALLGALRLSAGAPPQRPGEVVVGRTLGLAPGASVTVLTATGPATYTVTGVVDEPAIYVADATAATLGPGVHAVGLVLAPGADPDEVAAAARGIVGADGQVYTGDGRSALEPRDEAQTRWVGMQVLTGTAALAGFVTVFVVASTFAYTVTQRRREFGLLRTIGASPRQIKRMLYAEALVVGTTGALVGLALGTVFAPAVGDVLIDVGFEPATYTVRYTLWPAAVSFAVGPVVALLGVWGASWRASRVPPLEALREAAVEQRPMGRLRWIAGVLLVALGLALAIGTATSDRAEDGANFALYSAMSLVLGATVLAPAFVPLVVRAVTWPALRSRGAVALLVREGALTAARRTASTAAPVLLTVAFAVLVSGLVRTTTEAYAAGRAAAVRAGSVVAPDGTPGLTDAAVAAVPGAALLPTAVFAGDRPLTALGVDPAAFAAVNRRLEVVSGSIGDLRGDATVVVTESVVAASAGGAALTVRFADGEQVPLRVVAVVTDDSLPGDLLLSRPVVRQHDPSALTSAVYLSGPVELPPNSGARVLDVATYAAEADQEEDRLVWIFTLLLIGVSAGYGAIAVANTLLMAAAARKPDLRVLRLAGATRRQIARVVAAESAVVVLIGSVLGGAVAFVALLSIRQGLSAQAGAPVDLVVPWSVIGAVVGLCLLLATTASVLPALRR